MREEYFRVLRDGEFNPTPAPEVQVFPASGVRIIGTENWIERLAQAA
jgi:hypothetical protein